MAYCAPLLPQVRPRQAQLLARWHTGGLVHRQGRTKQQLCRGKQSQIQCSANSDDSQPADNGATPSSPDDPDFSQFQPGFSALRSIAWEGEDDDQLVCHTDDVGASTSYVRWQANTVMSMDDFDLIDLSAHKQHEFESHRGGINIRNQVNLPTLFAGQTCTGMHVFLQVYALILQAHANQSWGALFPVSMTTDPVSFPWRPEHVIDMHSG